MIPKTETTKPHRSTLARVGEFFVQFSLGIRIGLVLGAAFFVTCLVIASLLDRWWLNILLCLGGGALGWLVGILASPTSPAESRSFAEYRRALSAFVGGFLLARLDLLISRFDFARIDEPYLQLGRVLLLVTTFILAVQFTFVPRFTAAENKASAEQTGALNNEL